jgi:hypothetical protein
MILIALDLLLLLAALVAGGCLVLSIRFMRAIERGESLPHGWDRRALTHAAIAALLIGVISCALGVHLGKRGVAEQCQEYGVFSDDGRIFDCWERPYEETEA